MSNPYILIASGFILPQNEYFEVLTKEKISNTSIFNRTVLVTTNSTVASLVDTGQIYHSESATEAFIKYENSGSFEDYMRMVDMASDILGRVDYNKFFELQASNRFISPYSLKMCVDLLKKRFAATHHEYGVVPFNIRFSADNGKSETQIQETVKILRNSKTFGTNTWEQLLAGLANDRNAFSTFFKYIFVDNY
jgi:GTP-dependent phosphoenolpyruvate carboxykinase